MPPCTSTNTHTLLPSAPESLHSIQARTVSPPLSPPRALNKWCWLMSDSILLKGQRLKKSPGSLLVFHPCLGEAEGRQFGAGKECGLGAKTLGFWEKGLCSHMG